MKANRNFKEADEAVSPVIGVILMVAITVVLAAVVFVLVNDLGSSGDSAPTMGISADEGDDRLNVDKAPAETVAWSDITATIQGANSTTYIYLDISAAADDSDLDITNGTALPSADGNIAGGDYLELCSDGHDDTSDITVVLTHDPSGQVIKRVEFSSIAAC